MSETAAQLEEGAAPPTPKEPTTPVAAVEGASAPSAVDADVKPRSPSVIAAANARRPSAASSVASSAAGSVAAAVAAANAGANAGSARRPSVATEKSPGMLAHSLEKLMTQQLHSAVPDPNKRLEMPDSVAPEDEVESGESKAKTLERMRKMAAGGAVGAAATGMGVGLRDIGMAISQARGMADRNAGENAGRLDIKAIAKQAEVIEARAKYTWEDLKDVQIKGVEPTRKEDFLSDDQFDRAFGMSREAFYEKPQWKRNELKKKVGLF